MLTKLDLRDLDGCLVVRSPQTREALTQQDPRPQMQHAEARYRPASLHDDIIMMNTPMLTYPFPATSLDVNCKHMVILWI